MDESGFNTSMTRLRARAPRGERAYGRVPRKRGKNQTLIASITLEGAMGAVGLHRGGHRLRALRGLPRALPGAVARRGAGGGARRAWGAQDPEGEGASSKSGARSYVFLPPYSPDLNPYRGGLQRR